MSQAVTESQYDHLLVDLLKYAHEKVEWCHYSPHTFTSEWGLENLKGEWKIDSLRDFAYDNFGWRESVTTNCLYMFTWYLLTVPFQSQLVFEIHNILHREKM